MTDYPLGGTARTVSVTATAQPEWKDAVVVRSPGWSGIVTEVLVTEGQPLTSGSPVGRVDGTEIRYYELATQLYRNVCSGDSEQVDIVRDILAQEGLEVSSRSTFSWTDVEAVRDYAESIRAPDASRQRCFDLAWVVSSQDNFGTVASTALTVGALGPARGEPVLTEEAELVGLTLSGTTGISSIDGSLTDPDSAWPGTTEIIASGQQTGVRVDDLDDPEALAVLAPLIESTEGEEPTTLAINLNLADHHYVVPATAVVDALVAASCVETSDGRTVPVRVMASTTSGVVIDLSQSPEVASIRLRPEANSCE